MTKNEIMHYGIKFDVDDKDLKMSKQNLNEILNSLEAISDKASSASVTQSLDSGLQQASKDAKELRKILTDSWDYRLGQLDLVSFNKNMQKAGLSAQSLKTSFSGAGKEGLNAFNQITHSVLTTNIELKKSNEFLNKMALTFANTIRFSISSSAINNLTSQISKAYNYSKDLDKSLNDIRIVSGQSADQMERFAKYANAAAKSTGATTLDYTDAALIYYQQGLSESEVKKRTDITIKAANVLGDSADEVSNYLTAIWNNFAKGSENLEYFADVLAKLGAETASSAEEISQGLEKFAAVGETVGLSYEYAAAALTTVTDRTRQSADVVGTAFKTLFARLQGLKLGETLEDDTDLNKYSKALAAVGIDIKDQTGNLKDMDDILDEMGSKWQTLSKDQQVALAQTVAGTRQYTQLVSLMDNWDFFTENVNRARNATGALQEQQDIYMDSVEAHLNKMRAEAEKTYDILFDTKSVNSFYDAISGLLKLMNSFLGGLGGGLNTAGFLASGALNLMSGQIAKEGVRISANLERNKKIQQGQGIQQQYIDILNSTEDTNTPQGKALAKQKELLKDIAEIEGYITKEKEQQLIKQQELIGKNIEYIEEQRNYLDNLSKVDIFKDDIEKLRIEYGYYAKDVSQEKKDTLNSEILTQVLSNNNNYKKILDEQKNYENILDKKSLLNKLINNNETDFNKISKDLNDILNEDFVKDFFPEQGELNQFIKQRFEKDPSLKASIDNVYEIIYDSLGGIGTGQEQKQAFLDWLKLEYESPDSDKSNYNDFIAFLQEAIETRTEYRQDIINAVQEAQQSRKFTKEKLPDLERETNEQIANQKAETDNIKLEQKIQGWTSLIGVIGQVTTLTTGLMSNIEQMQKGTISLGDGLRNIFVSLGSGIAMIAPQIMQLTPFVTKLAASFGLVEASAAKAWLAVLGPIAAVAIAIGTIIKLIEISIDNSKRQEQAAQRASEIAAEMSNNYKEAQQRAEDLKITIESYNSAIEQMQKLDHATQEYTDSLTKANEEAKKLIEQYNLYNDFVYENGAIKFNEGVLDNLQSDINNRVLQAEANKNNAQLSQTNLNNIIKSQGIANDFGTYYYKDGKRVTGSDADGAERVNISSQMTRVISEALTELRQSTSDADQKTYLEATQSSEAFENWIKSLNNIDKDTKLLADVIATRVKDFKQITEKVVADEQSRQMQLDSIQQAALLQNFGSTIDSMATKKNGKVDEGSRRQIAAAAVSTDVSNFIEEEKDRVRKEIDLAISNTGFKDQGLFSGANGTVKELSKSIKEWTNGQLDLNMKTTEDMARQYATHVKNLTEQEVDALTWVDNQLKNMTTGEVVADMSTEDNRAYVNQATTSAILTNYEDSRIDEQWKNAEAKTLELIGNIRQKFSQEGEKIGINMADAITNSLASGKLDMSQFFDTLTTAQVQSIKETDSNELWETWDFTEIAQLKGNEFAESLMSSMLESLDSFQYDARAHIDKILEGRDDEFKELGLDKDDLADYAEHLTKVANGFEDVQDNSSEVADTLEEDAKAAVDVAKSVMRMNSGIEKLNKGYEEWIDVLQKSGAESQEYFESLKQLRDATGDLLDLTEDAEKSLDGDFFEKNADLIAQAANGSAEAIDQLRAEALEPIILGMELDTSSTLNNEELWNRVQQIQDELNNHPFEWGTNVDLTGLHIGEESMLDFMNQMILDANMTREQVNTMLSGMGFTANFNTEPQKVMVKEPDRVITHHTVIHKGKTELANGAYVENYDEVTTTETQPGEVHEGSVDAYSMETTEPGVTVVPKINSLVKKGTGSSNNWSPRNSGGGSVGKSSGGGGGGGSQAKEPNKMDPVEEQADRYHQVNTQITKVDNSLKKLTSQEKKFVGAKLIDNLNKQWALLNTQVENYNEKLRIAQDESAELRDKLAGKGTKFNADGTISNYMEVYAAQEAYVNSLINNYNNMSAEEQESYKEVVEKAKEDFKEFQKDLDRYDTLVSNEIPQLSQSIQDVLDKQIELNIKKFNMEVDITLNFSEAERDWNAWKAKVMDGVKEDDILGNAKARLQDFSTYYNDAATASIQVQTRHLEDTLTELRKMDQGLDNIYGDNRTQALEDLQKYYKQLMEDLEGVLDLQNEIHQKHLDMMDEASDKFKEQVENFEMINELVDNNIKMVQLIYGDDSYHQLERFYDKQNSNNLAQLDFLRQQRDVWAQQMEMFEENSEEWEKAKEKWMDAAKDLSKALEDALDNAREAFENAIKGIFKDLNDQVTNGLGLDYVKEEWDLINKQADEYLDDINAIAGIHNLEKKYVDTLNDSTNPKNQQRIKALMDSELVTLKSMDKISQNDLDRAEKKYNIMVAQLALEDAQQQKTQMRLRRDSQGNYRYQYVADQDAINKAKEELQNLYVDLYNFDKKKYTDNLNEIYDLWDEYQQKMAEAALINDPEKRQQRELLLNEYYGELINNANERNTAYRTELEESAFMTQTQLYQDDIINFRNLTEQERELLTNEVGGAFTNLLTVYGIDAEAFKRMTDEEKQAIIANLTGPNGEFNEITGFYNEDKEHFDSMAESQKDILTEKMVPQWNSAIQDMSDKITKKGGFEPTVANAMHNIQNETAKYDKQIADLSTTAGTSTTKIANSLSKDTQATQSLVDKNKNLIETYVGKDGKGGLLGAVKSVADNIDNLIKKYKNSEAAAKKATQAAHDYWMQEQQNQAKTAKNQNQTTSSAGSNNNSASKSTPAPAPVNNSINGAVENNGVIEVGDYVTLKGDGKLSKDSYTRATLSTPYAGHDLYVQNIVDKSRPSPYHLGISKNFNDSSSWVGWVDKDQIAGYDTGGYTGAWSDSNGRLAMLHQKELVLNAQDTENMLNTVAIMRQLATSLGENVLSRLAGVAAKAKNGNDNTATLEQNVHIDATFPNVRDAKEIENALNNLVNSASQRVFEKR